MRLWAPYFLLPEHPARLLQAPAVGTETLHRRTFVHEDTPPKKPASSAPFRLTDLPSIGQECCCCVFRCSFGQVVTVENRCACASVRSCAYLKRHLLKDVLRRLVGHKPTLRR